MSRFNKGSSTQTINQAGGKAFSQTPELELVSILLTSFLKDQFYRDSSDVVDRITQLVNMVDPKFTAQAAIYARTKYGMRSVTHVVAGEIAKKIHNKPWLTKFFKEVVHRPDDMTEIMAYLKATDSKMTHAMARGFGMVLSGLDEYKLAKYKGIGKDFSLMDITNMVHPKPTEALGKLIKGTLPSPETWEVKLSQSGQGEVTEEKKSDLKNVAWRDLVLENKIGYFALLRNLRNIIEQAPEVLDKSCELLTNKESIKKSLVLPFRFMTAVKQLQEDGINNPKVYRALNEALETSMSNIPIFEGKTLVVVDHSGSMDSVEHGNMSNFEIGALFGVALAKTNGADFMCFGDYAKYWGINPMDSTPTIIKSIGDDTGSGTNFNSIFEEAKEKYDRIVIFSDMQGWIGGGAPISSYNEYKIRTSANPKIYSFDLSSYGNMQFPQSNVYCLAGFSDKVFDIMKFIELDKNALIHEIEKIDL